MQNRIETLLQARILRQRLTDGRDQAFVVKPGDVIASVVEYRPVYVSGDVLTPGQQTYRASMTVRQAVAVAGGFSLLRSRGMQPGATDPADLVRDYQSLATEYTKEYFHIVRTGAELDGRDTFDATPPSDISLPAGVIGSGRSSREGLSEDLTKRLPHGTTLPGRRRKANGRAVRYAQEATGR